MKHLMRYEGYTSKERVDDILDKISKYGVESLSKDECDFLDSHQSGEQESYHSKLVKKESETVFEDDNGYFKFELHQTNDFDDEIHFIGTIYVPDLVLPSGQKVEGRLNGSIIYFKKTGQTIPDFYPVTKSKTSEDYDIFEFCNGLEYELDNFIDYIVVELTS